MVDGYFIVSSNRLPDCSNSNHQDYLKNWQPIEYRMKLIELDEQHPTQKFPYNAHDIACALYGSLLLMNQGVTNLFSPRKRELKLAIKNSDSQMIF